MNIVQMLKSGASLRYREPKGFYLVQQGISHPCDQAEARKLVEQRKVRPNTKDQHGVYLFALA